MSAPTPPPPPPDDEIPPPPPPPPPDDDDNERRPLDEDIIDFEELAARAAKIAREQQRANHHHRQRKTTSATTPANVPVPPPPPPLGGRTVDEEDAKRMDAGDAVWGIALSSCSEYPNKKYFFRRDSHDNCQWETPKELKGGLQKNLRICPLKATLLAQNTMPESGWVELTTSTWKDDEEDVTGLGKKKARHRATKYYWHPASKRVTWRRPKRDDDEVREAEIVPLAPGTRPPPSS